MRLFLAILLAEPVVIHLRGVRDALPTRREISWVRPENWHVTLKFLGECDPRRVDTLIPALGELFDGTPSLAPFELQPAGLELFPARGPVRVIAAALTGEVEHLAALNSAVERCLEPLGFASEARLFRGHITLARARPPLHRGARAEFESATAPLAAGPRFTVDAVHLMQSELTRTGSVYTELKRFDLKPADATRGDR